MASLVLLCGQWHTVIVVMMGRVRHGDKPYSNLSGLQQKWFTFLLLLQL